MMLVVGVGLAVNVVGCFILKGGAEASLNVKGACLEALSDMLSSLGVIAAVLVIWRTGRLLAAPSMAIMPPLQLVHAAAWSSSRTQGCPGPGAAWPLEWARSIPKARP